VNKPIFGSFDSKEEIDVDNQTRVCLSKGDSGWKPERC
jgi:hypothetical protein